MKKLMVEVTLIAVTQDIEIKAGDHLMIFDNKLLGIYTGRETAPVKDAQKVLTGKAGGTAKAKAAALFPRERLKEIAERIVELVTNKPGVRFREIAGEFGVVHHANRRQYGQINNLVAALLKDGKLLKTPGKHKFDYQYFPPSKAPTALAS